MTDLSSCSVISNTSASHSVVLIPLDTFIRRLSLADTAASEFTLLIRYFVLGYAQSLKCTHFGPLGTEV